MIKLGLALIPSTSCIDRLIQNQQAALSIEPLVPQLGFKKNIPHITLLQGTFTNFEVVSQCLEALFHFIKSSSDVKLPLSFLLDQIEYVDSGWYFLNTKDSTFLQSLHELSFKQLNSKMIVTNEDKSKDLSTYNDIERENFLKYGYRYIGKAYKPHITLGRTPNKKPSVSEKELIKALAYPESMMEFQALTIYKFGPNGSHEETLKQITIS